MQSRLVATLPPLIVALAIHRWWALELVGLMLLFGLALDVCVYDKLIDYQPGWLALPLGAGELGLIVLATRMPLTWRAFDLFALGWVTAQVCGHGLFPRLRLEYAQSGGELGRLGAIVATAVAAVTFASIAGAVAVIPPTVHLHGVVQGPLVITHAQTLVGGVVRGGVVIRSDHVTLKNVTIVGGEYGVDIAHAQHVMLDRVRLLDFKMDAVHALDSSLMVHRCSVSAPASPLANGILITYSMGRPMSMVQKCRIVGVREGITTHSSMVDVVDNDVVGTTLHGISLSEMSMDTARGNRVESARGIAILCMDHSVCEISHNTITGALVDGNQDPSRQGIAIESYFYAEAHVHHNTVVASPGGVQALDLGVVTR
ncbi:MAG TPA: right-handed parallel beta-helix repeat-containing protein [Gaiellaceae bacterium]